MSHAIKHSSIIFFIIIKNFKIIIKTLYYINSKIIRGPSYQNECVQ